METTENLLQKIWRMGEEALTEAKMNKASKRLQRQAEIEVGKSQDAVEEVESLFEAAVRESLDTGDFDKISKANLNLLTLQKTHESNLSTYKTVFGSNPKLLA